jgi:hypothetical protein
MPRAGQVSEADVNEFDLLVDGELQYSFRVHPGDSSCWIPVRVE